MFAILTRKLPMITSVEASLFSNKINWKQSTFKDKLKDKPNVVNGI